MARANNEAPPESDRFPDAPHPRETTGLIGHSEVEQALLAAYRAGKLPHAIIFGGATGIGKATLAWRLARFLLTHPDPSAVEVQSATDLFVPKTHSVARQISALSHGDIFLLRREWNEKTKRWFTEISADSVREAVHLFQRSAAGGYRICIIDSAEDLNRHGANALLKIIEDPPPRSLFLIVAHRPERILPTVRSRCRCLLLKSLSDAEIASVIAELGEPWSTAEPDSVALAADRAGGSVASALKLLGGGLERDRGLQKLLSDLPSVDWQAVHELSDQMTGREGAADYEMMMTGVAEWIDAVLRREAKGGAARLAPLAEVWEKAAEAARQAEVLNLDKRPIVLSLFADLAKAAKTLAA